MTPGRHPATEALDVAQKAQDRVAGAITSFAGSMTFVYIHAVIFTAWIVFRVEKFPFGLLTMVVSLEAIFLSTFVMISQNRADEKREAIAAVDHENLKINTELTKAIAEQTKKIDGLAAAVEEIKAVGKVTGGG